MICLSITASQIVLRPGERGQQVGDKPKRRRKSDGPLLPRAREDLFSGGLSGLQDFLTGDMRRRGPLRDKGQVEVVDDAVHHGAIGFFACDLKRPRGHV